MRKKPEGGHLDDDAMVRTADRDNDGPAGSPVGAEGNAGATGLAGSPVGAGNTDDSMTMGKLELTPAVARTLRRAHERRGAQATPEEINHMVLAYVMLLRRLMRVRI